MLWQDILQTLSTCTLVHWLSQLSQEQIPVVFKQSFRKNLIKFYLSTLKHKWHTKVRVPFTLSGRRPRLRKWILTRLELWGVSWSNQIKMCPPSTSCLKTSHSRNMSQVANECWTPTYEWWCRIIRRRTMLFVMVMMMFATPWAKVLTHLTILLITTDCNKLASRCSFVGLLLCCHKLSQSEIMAHQCLNLFIFQDLRLIFCDKSMARQWAHRKCNCTPKGTPASTRLGNQAKLLTS